MSDQTIDQLYASLKVLNERIEKLGQTVNRLDVHGKRTEWYATKEM